MARAYLQGQERESEPEPEESARPDGSHRYRYPQKQGYQCHHHHHVDDVHAPHKHQISVLISFHIAVLSPTKKHRLLPLVVQFVNPS